MSNWERGETLPDTAILPDLADVLETTADNLLRGGEFEHEHWVQVVTEYAEKYGVK